MARTLPLSASTIAIILLSQPTYRRRSLRSIESPLGSVHGASGHFGLHFQLAGINRRQFAFVFDIDVNHALRIAGRELRLAIRVLIVPNTFPVAASIAVESWLRPLKVKTRFVAGS